jgi:hypothetical protein
MFEIASLEGFSDGLVEISFCWNIPLREFVIFAHISEKV